VSNPPTASDSHPRHEDARQALLRAAIQVFAGNGEAGARTDAIARAAGVNKALLHYYFGTKEGLYAAVLEEVFSGIAAHFSRVLDGPGSPGQRLLGYFLAHFDHLGSSPNSAGLMGHEMMRARAGQTSNLSRITTICFAPLHHLLCATLAEGIQTGELRDQPPGPVVLSLVGANVFYFMSAPVFREIAGADPRDPECLVKQRATVIDMAATVLYSDPEQGRRIGLALLQR
jgi:TetR/AcrR family transcriptional regulator